MKIQEGINRLDLWRYFLKNYFLKWTKWDKVFYLLLKQFLEDLRKKEGIR